MHVLTAIRQRKGLAIALAIASLALGVAFNYSVAGPPGITHQHHQLQPAPLRVEVVA